MKVFLVARRCEQRSIFYQFRSVVIVYEVWAELSAPSYEFQLSQTTDERGLMKNAVWISYDLGVRGDYEGLYTWLAEHNAKECGNSLAFISYEYKKDLLKELKSDLVRAMSPSKRTRVYTIHLDPTTKKMKGTFLIGGRKAPPWTGFAAGTQEEDDGV